MIILQEPISRDTLMAMLENHFSDMVKGVVDTERELLALNAELHADLETLLLKSGSKQEHLWGINLYPDMEGEDLVEFDSLINIRPWQGNRSRGVEDDSIRRKIREVVSKWVSL